MESLRLEWQKGQPNKARVSELMKITFGQRRKEIEKNDEHINEVLKKCPCYGDFDEVNPIACHSCIYAQYTVYVITISQPTHTYTM